VLTQLTHRDATALGIVMGLQFAPATTAPTLDGIGCGPPQSAQVPDAHSRQDTGFATALALSGAAILTFINGTNSIMQLSTEPSMRSSVMAIRVGLALGDDDRRSDCRLGRQSLRPALVARSGCRGVLCRCPGRRSLRSGSPRRATPCPEISPVKVGTTGDKTLDAYAFSRYLHSDAGVGRRAAKLWPRRARKPGMHVKLRYLVAVASS
jgi:hypothetical protein